VLRERDDVLREDLAAPPPAALPRDADEALRAPLERVEPEVDDLARAALDLAPPLFAFDDVEREPDDFAREPLDRELDDFAREPADLRAPLLREDEDDEPEPVPALALPSIDHLPDITRCAASATASAISEPSLVALATTLLAACVAVSAASRPASRIARRALGLALIAAAAAARPAASISLLIAALASLSTVSLLFEEEPEEALLEDLLRADLAIASSPSVSRKRHFSAVTVPE
jgi:hypothetical protein